MPFVVVILAGGEGKRMRSETPKVLHPCAGIPMLVRVIRTVAALSPAKTLLVAGKHKELIQETLLQWDITAESIVYVDQPVPQGTGHALRCCLGALTPEDLVLVLNGDMPLICTTLLQELLSKATCWDVALLTTVLEDPTGYGRIVADDNGTLLAIVEDKDCTALQKQLHEVNTGVYVFAGAVLHDCLPRISNLNRQREYYLTDIIGLAKESGYSVGRHRTDDDLQVRGANTPQELEELSQVAISAPSPNIRVWTPSP